MCYSLLRTGLHDYTWQAYISHAGNIHTRREMQDCELYVNAVCASAILGTGLYINAPVDFCTLAEGNNVHGRSASHNIRRRSVV